MWHDPSMRFDRAITPSPIPNRPAGVPEHAQLSSSEGVPMWVWQGGPARPERSIVPAYIVDLLTRSQPKRVEYTPARVLPPLGKIALAVLLLCGGKA